MPWTSFSVPICAVGSDLRRDPNYISKANAPFHEFEEVGMNRQLGYESPAKLERPPMPSVGNAVTRVELSAGPVIFREAGGAPGKHRRCV